MSACCICHRRLWREPKRTDRMRHHFRSTLTLFELVQSNSDGICELVRIDLRYCGPGRILSIGNGKGPQTVIDEWYPSPTC